MNIFQLNELTDEMMNLSNQDFYSFIEMTLNKDLCELFQVHTIGEMSALPSVTIDELIQIFNFEIDVLKDLKKALGFTTSDGKFHLRLGQQKLLEHLLLLVQRNKTTPVNARVLSNNFMENDTISSLMKLLRNRIPNSSDGQNISILNPWIINIFENLQTTKNKYRYDIPIQQFTLLIYILGGRNRYEFLRLNLTRSLPHVSHMDSLIRDQGMRMTESEFRLKLAKEYLKSSKFNYVFVAEDATSSTSCIDYDAISNLFIGFSLPLVDGIPQPNYFQTDDFDQLQLWFNELDKAKFINLYMLKSLAISEPAFILAAHGSDNKAEVIDILKRWLFIYDECLIQNTHVIGFSSDADPRFFATLPNFDVFKRRDFFRIKLPNSWSWFLTEDKQILFFMQHPIHIATKFRNRLRSATAKLNIGSYPIDIQHIFDLIQSESKLEHNLIKCDVDPKDCQNFLSCVRISSENVLNLLQRNEKAKGTFVYLSLLRSIIVGFIETATTIEER